MARLWDRCAGLLPTTLAKGGLFCRCGAFIRAALGMRMLPEGKGRQPGGSAGWARERGVAMPWFPDFVSAVELARRQTRAAGQADPVAQYFTALNEGDTHLLEDVWPGEVVVYDPRAGEIRGHRQLPAGHP